MGNEQQSFESPVPPYPFESELESFNPPKKKKIWLIIVIIFAVLVVVAGSILALFLIEKAKADEREKRAAVVKVNDDPELSKKSFKTGKKKDETSQDEEDETDEDEDETEGDEMKYLEPTGWAIKFTYPEGVVDVKYVIQNENYNGELYIMSIATADKIYDVNRCGGKAAYEQYPFFLGQISRWDPKAKHDDWETSPLSAGGSLALKDGDIEYFVNTTYGNGCETGDMTPDYVEALKISKKLIDSMEKK